jgi:hypothetical protein
LDTYKLKLENKPINMSTTNNNESRNSLPSPIIGIERYIYIHPFQRAFLSRWWFSTICLSTLPPSPLTAVAHH